MEVDNDRLSLAGRVSYSPPVFSEFEKGRRSHKYLHKRKHVLVT